MDYEAFAAHAYTDPHSPSNTQDTHAHADGDADADADADVDVDADMTDATRISRETAAVKRKDELDAAARNGQWLKFNDETVLKVGPLSDLTLNQTNCPPVLL